jgi:hypothetical protein
MQHANKALPYVLENLDLLGKTKSIIRISSEGSSLEITDTTASKDICLAIEQSIFKCNEIFDPASKYISETFNADRLKVSYNNLNRLTSTRIRNSAFKLIHGDIYPQARLKNFNLSDSDLCPRCNAIETREHLIFECPTSKALCLSVVSLESATLIKKPIFRVRKMQLKLLTRSQNKNYFEIGS